MIGITVCVIILTLLLTYFYVCDYNQCDWEMQFSRTRWRVGQLRKDKEGNCFFLGAKSSL